MPDRRNPHNSYFYQQPGQASPIYVPPSKSTQRILPVPQAAGQGDYHYGMPGQAAPIYVPPSRVQPTQPKPVDRPPETTVAKEKKGGGGIMGGAMMGSMLSDERSKTEIARLEGQNEALTAALDQSFNGSNMPETEYPELPQNTRVTPPSHANFADTPAANRVAAQNVAMAPAQAGQAPPMAAPRPAAPAWNPTAGAAPPDLSALDEAYRRIGATQGG